MTESRKRLNTASPATTTQPNQMNRTAAPIAKPRPSIVGTKASEARAKAIKTAQLSATRSTPKRKRAATEQPNTTVKSYHTTASALKQRPAWDLRGKVQDMTYLYELNLQKLEDLQKHKREMEILKSEKESEEKDALQKANELREELVTMERNHQSDISDLHANQRIEYQRLEDENLNFKRQLGTIDNDVKEARNKLDGATKQLEQIRNENQALRDTIENMSRAYEEAVAEIRSLRIKVEKIGKSITEREEEVRHKKSQIEKITKSNHQLQEQFSQSKSKRARLLSIIKDLEVCASNSKRVVTKNQA